MKMEAMPPAHERKNQSSRESFHMQQLHRAHSLIDALGKLQLDRDQEMVVIQKSEGADGETVRAVSSVTNLVAALEQGVREGDANRREEIFFESTAGDIYPFRYGFTMDTDPDIVELRDLVRQQKEGSDEFPATEVFDVRVGAVKAHNLN